MQSNAIACDPSCSTSSFHRLSAAILAGHVLSRLNVPKVPKYQVTEDAVQIHLRSSCSNQHPQGAMNPHTGSCSITLFTYTFPFPSAPSRLDMRRHSRNSLDKISPLPLSSTLNTSITGAFSLFRILHTPPSSEIVFFNPINYPPKYQHTSLHSPHPTNKKTTQENLQSKNPAVKLIHTLPSHVPFPLFFTVLGKLSVCSSSRLSRTPSLLLNPTMIFGTPKRKDWIQNLSNLRSYFRISRSVLGVAAVLSSTQLMGPVEVVEGLVSQTIFGKQ